MSYTVKRLVVDRQDQITWNIIINIYNVVWCNWISFTFFQLPTLGCLTVLVDCFHKNSHLAFWWINTADDGKPERFRARLLDKLHFPQCQRVLSGRICLWRCSAVRQAAIRHQLLFAFPIRNRLLRSFLIKRKWKNSSSLESIIDDSLLCFRDIKERWLVATTKHARHVSKRQ